MKYDYPDISKATVIQIMGHFWYLSDELVDFCVFDQNFSVKTKRKIVYAMIKDTGLYP